MGGQIILGISVVFVLFFAMNSIFAQSDVETSEQTTLSDELLHNPLAQEILQKIEESKRKIAKLEQQNYENLQAQKFLEDRRVIALERLNQKLTLWEEKWYEFSPKVAYQNLLTKCHLVFKGFMQNNLNLQKKYVLGVTAKTNALDNGMTSFKALQNSTVLQDQL